MTQPELHSALTQLPGLEPGDQDTVDWVAFPAAAPDIATAVGVYIDTLESWCPIRTTSVDMLSDRVIIAVETEHLSTYTDPSFILTATSAGTYPVIAHPKAEIVNEYIRECTDISFKDVSPQLSDATVLVAEHQATSSFQYRHSLLTK